MEFPNIIKKPKTEKTVLNSTVKRLEELNLITAAERRNIEAKFTSMAIQAGLYELLSKKDIITATKMFGIIRQLNGSEEMSKEEETALVIETPISTADQQNLSEPACLQTPFAPAKRLGTHAVFIRNFLHFRSNGPVIHYLFGFLSAKDIKNCRLVFREWRSIGMTALTKRAAVVKICRENHPVAINRLTRFFTDNQQYIKDLTLSNLHLTRYGNENMVENLDISPWLMRSLIANPDHEYLTKLSIETDETTALIIPLQIIAYVKELTLRFCIVNIKNGIRIRPQKLELKNVEFKNDGIELPNVKINDIVNLSSIKKMWLSCSSSRTQLILDLKGAFSMEILDMECVKMLNWKTSKWNIDLLAMYGQDFTQKTEMKISKLHFAAKKIDLAVLPQTIEQLRISKTGIRITYVVSTRKIQLRRLKYLELELAFIASSVLPLFKDCPQLSQLDLNGFGFMRPCQVKSSLLIPRTVKTLKLVNMSINWAWRDSLNLDTLVLQCSDYRLVREIFIANSVVKTLILEMNWYPNSEPNFFDFSWEFQELCTYGRKRLYVRITNKFNGDLPFEESCLHQYVDKKSSCYVFENREDTKGRAISDKDFDDIFGRHIKQVNSRLEKN